MTSRNVPPEVLRLWDEPLPQAEFEARLAQARAELEGPEGDNVRALIEWFQRRYPTPLDRLRYSRRKRAITGA